jgi:signal transduction histidine kinase
MRLVRIGGVTVWIAIGVHVLLNGATTRLVLGEWAIAYLAFGAAFMFRPSRATLLVQSGAVIAMVLLLCNGFEGTLLVIIAMQLGGMMSRRAAITWIVVQTLLLFIAISIHWAPRPAMLIAPPYLGFELLAYFALDALAREATAHAELRAVSGILADSSRIAERLRISRELHDVLGHHLTALSLNLEAAVQRTEGDAREHVQTAQSLAKKLLTDVREIAASMPAQPGIDLEQALGSLVSDLPRPKVHLEIEPGIRIDDPERAHIVVRCTQEIVTNAARHSAANNLWIVIARDGDSVRIHARDDGRGTSSPLAGFGLRSMRDRLEGAGGQLHVDTRPGLGFEVTALLPARPA